MTSPRKQMILLRQIFGFFPPDSNSLGSDLSILIFSFRTIILFFLNSRCYGGIDMWFPVFLSEQYSINCVKCTEEIKTTGSSQCCLHYPAEEFNDGIFNTNPVMVSGLQRCCRWVNKCQ